MNYTDIIHQYVNKTAMSIHTLLVFEEFLKILFHFNGVYCSQSERPKITGFYMQDKPIQVFYRNFIKEGNLLATIFDEQYFLNSFNIVIMRNVIPEY